MQERLEKTTGHASRRAFATALALAAAIGLAPSLAPAPAHGPADGLAGVDEADGESVDRTRATLEKWVETRRILSDEARDWAIGRELLQERVELVKREIQSLRERISEAEGSIAEADEKRADLFDENERLKRASNSLVELVGRLEASTVTLLGRSPEVVRDRVKPLSQRIPRDAAATKSSLGERFQNVVGILDQVNRFQREVTVVSEVRELDAGTSAEVTTLYLGLGQAFYATADGTAAGVGTATEDGWVWRSANDAAAEIAQAIGILKDNQVAEFVRVPMQVR